MYNVRLDPDSCLHTAFNKYLTANDPINGNCCDIFEILVIVEVMSLSRAALACRWGRVFAKGTGAC